MESYQKYLAAMLGLLRLKTEKELEEALKEREQHQDKMP